MDAIGTLYVDTNGDAYRLRSIRRISGTPDYTVHYVEGASSSVSVLPETATVVWWPPTHPCGDYPAPCNCDDPSTHNGHQGSASDFPVDIEDYR